MNTNFIQVSGLSFRIGSKPILAAVSFAVEEGEYLSIIGPNGAGKSTLLKCLNRILTGYEGNILVRGRPLAEYSPAALARLVGYVPQASGRVLPFTVHDFVMMGRYPHLSPFSTVTDRDRHAVGDALARTGMEAFAQRMLDTLSGGERQKVFVAAALAQEARLLLLDEPTTFLDPHHQAELCAILAALNRENGVAIVSVTHDLNRAALTSTRILALKQGRNVYHGEPAGVMTGATLRAIYDQDFLLSPHPTAGVPMILPEVIA